VDLLFVYGTLRSEFDNPYARLLRSQAELVGAATVPGSIFRIGHYPGYRPEPRGVVLGELYRMADPGATLKILDEYEGAEYERVAIRILIEEGVGWIYQYRTQPDESARIASGDFRRP
jgi:gamma-glutamylcyclotransferase (GGCT)/AIG2-like uncharacterized protein YtfP